MSRRNKINVDSQLVTIEKLSELIKSNQKSYETLIINTLSQFSTLSQAGLGIDRKLLYSWKKHGLLPYQEAESGKATYWTRFSFVELCWLKVLMEFRELGVGLDSLKVLKEQLFPEDILEKISPLIDIDQFSKLLPKAFESLNQKNAVKADKSKLIEIPKNFQGKTQLSFFAFFIYSTALLNTNHVLYVDNKGQTGYFNLDAWIKEPDSGVKELNKILSKQSLAMVNLKKVKDYYLGLLEDLPLSPQGAEIFEQNSLKALNELLKHIQR